MGISPCGQYLATGSGKGGVVTFDLTTPHLTSSQRVGSSATLGLGESVGFWPGDRTREVSAVDWGKDCLAACADDLVTRIWRSDVDVARGLREDKGKWGYEWVGASGL